MFTQFTACVSHDICAKLARNLGAWSTHFRKEIWGASLRNSRSGRANFELVDLLLFALAHL